MTDKKKISQQKALEIAGRTEQVQSFYSMSPILKPCIAFKISDSCNSPWVTCLEDAWVIEYYVQDECRQERAKEDMRLIMVLNAITGKFISKFPEVEYIKQKDFCLDDEACRCIKTEAGSTGCINFFQGAVLGKDIFECSECRCVQEKCVKNP